MILTEEQAREDAALIDAVLDMAPLSLSGKLRLSALLASHEALARALRVAEANILARERSQIPMIPVAAQKRMETLEAALREVEWGCSAADSGSCPACGAADFRGHHDDCVIRAALAR